MKFLLKSPSHALLGFCIWCMHLLCLVERSTAQTTDPFEAATLNSIFQQWGISESSRWNISGELCSGDAITESGASSPGIRCQCTFNGGSICRIVSLSINGRNITGQIPEAIGNLTLLSNLDLTGNYLTGPLPSSIGNLGSMQSMSFAGNLLSGSIPEELGNLLNLSYLYLSTNNFNGPLPPQMGNLVNLRVLTLDSSGVSGPIPSTFANLVNLEKLWAFDNELTGTIPDFIGSWTKLNLLELHGNAFQGPIPSSLSSLTSLTALRIGELTGGSSSLAFIKGMRNLTILILRNSQISDGIPFDIGEYQSLQHLDLSFNDLTGEIPSSLFTLSSLSSLFLGNNSLSGNLPSSKSSSLTNIDLSYNQLSGSFPSWVTQGLQLNLVANNFVINGSNNRFSTLHSGLNCLQRSFSCYQDSLTNSSFAINCGGQDWTSKDGMLYDSDVNALRPSSYYLASASRLAVSNVGLNENDLYTTDSMPRITDTSDPELFWTTRVSQGSLRYYKLGLVNGQYIVTLQFAEIQIVDSIGRRVFDIFAQGNLQLKDFDIRKEADGVSNSAVLKTFKVIVSKNYLEIHLFWAGKGTCCRPVMGNFGPSISAIWVTPDLPPPTASGKKNKTGLIVGIVVGAVALIFIFVSVIFIWRRRSNKDEEPLDMGAKPKTFSYSELTTATGDFSQVDMGAKPKTFSYSELMTATRDFSQENRLGAGGFGAVYKGTLSDGTIVAAKQLSVASHHGKRQFVAEIVTISAVQHRNLVKLCGCCAEGEERILVYEYLKNGSLDHALFGESALHLTWPTRYNICLGMARGLSYLHEDSKPRIIHRDVKASNILLDADFNPKISDFGLAKLFDDNETHISTRLAGTFGYLAPEYAMNGQLTEKADVFGFGVVALEILGGRPNTDRRLEEDKMYLLEWAWNLNEANHPLELIDPTLSEFDERQALRMFGVALLCTQTSPVLRPSMSHVVAMLSGYAEVSSVTSPPSYLTVWQSNGSARSLTDYMSGGSVGTTTNGQEIIGGR